MAKMEADLEAVERYLAKVPEPARSTLEKVRATIRAAAPEGTVERIGYGMPGFYYKGALVWYAAAKEHCALYPTSGPIQELREELKKYSVSKGTIRFAVDRALPAALVKKIVKMQVARNEGKAK
ncbi:MAG: DUF1801 domain-containing protein [Candidatus Solibacter sp.]